MEACAPTCCHDLSNSRVPTRFPQPASAGGIVLQYIFLICLRSLATAVDFLRFRSAIGFSYAIRAQFLQQAKVVELGRGMMVVKRILER